MNCWTGSRISVLAFRLPGFSAPPSAQLLCHCPVLQAKEAVPERNKS
jgi:hypothetical protein